MTNDVKGTGKDSTAKNTHVKNVKQTFILSETLYNRGAEYCRLKGLKITDVLRTSFDEFLTRNNF